MASQSLTGLVLLLLCSPQVRVNTRLAYTQTKFNLLREESQGYAKLVRPWQPDS